jgi:hypothetical protein
MEMGWDGVVILMFFHAPRRFIWIWRIGVHDEMNWIGTAWVGYLLHGVWDSE